MANSYTVRPGDSLWKIARSNGLTLGELLAANPQFTAKHGRNPNLIYAGEVVNIPVKKFNAGLDTTTACQECQEYDGTQPGEPVGKVEKESQERYFIAVADRAVKGTLGAFYHYSVQYWRCDEDIPTRQEMSASEAAQGRPSATKIDGIELLRVTGWRVWIYEKEYIWSKTETWQQTDTSVSVIFLSDSSTKLAVLRHGNKSPVESVWNSLKQNAATYDYAEQGGSGFDGNFANWPNSKYQMPGSSPFNNSNTFVRTVITSVGLDMMELGSSHPGGASPSPIPNIYSDTPWREGTDAPPAPTTPP